MHCLPISINDDSSGFRAAGGTHKVFVGQVVNENLPKRSTGSFHSRSLRADGDLLRHGDRLVIHLFDLTFDQNSVVVRSDPAERFFHDAPELFTFQTTSRIVAIALFATRQSGFPFVFETTRAAACEMEAPMSHSAE